MAKLPLISTDTHVAVPLSLADELPAKYRKKAPHLDPRRTACTSSARSPSSAWATSSPTSRT